MRGKYLLNEHESATFFLRAILYDFQLLYFVISYTGLGSYLQILIGMLC
jgi:hypothetical protein